MSERAATLPVKRGMRIAAMTIRPLPVIDNVSEARQWIARHCAVMTLGRLTSRQFRCPLPAHNDTNPSAGANAAVKSRLALPRLRRQRAR